MPPPSCHPHPHHPMQLSVGEVPIGASGYSIRYMRGEDSSPRTTQMLDTVLDTLQESFEPIISAVCGEGRCVCVCVSVSVCKCKADAENIRPLLKGPMSPARLGPPLTSNSHPYHPAATSFW